MNNNVIINTGIAGLLVYLGRLYQDVVLDWIIENPWLVALCFPLLLSIVVHILAKMGLLQTSIFGAMYKDLSKDLPTGASQRKRLLPRDEAHLRTILENRKKPHPYLERADNILALWVGREKWSLEGFDRCWRIAFLYPLAVLLLVWAFTNKVQIGTTDVLPQTHEAWRRWIVVITIAFSSAWVYGGVSLTKKLDIVRHYLDNKGRIGKILSKLSNLWLDNLLFIFCLIGATTLVVTGSVIGSTTDFVIATFGFTVAFVGAVAGSFTFVGSVTGIIAGAISFAINSAIGFVIAFIAILIILGQFIMISRLNKTQWVYIGAIFIFYFIVYGSTVYWLPQLTSTKELDVKNLPFIFLFFLGILPLLNGLADWISLNATRKFIEDMQGSNKAIAWLYAWDIGIAFILTLLIYGGSLGILHAMQYAGWGVDVRAILVDLRDHPWGGQSNWFLALAITNFVPTIVHIALRISDKTKPLDNELCEDIGEFLKSNGNNATTQIASTIIYILKIQPWLDRITIVGLTLALIPLFGLGVPWCAGKLLG